MAKLTSNTDITFNDGYFTTEKTIPTLNNDGVGGMKVVKKYYATLNAMMTALCGKGSRMQCVVDCANEAIKQSGIDTAKRSIIAKEKSAVMV